MGFEIYRYQKFVFVSVYIEDYCSFGIPRCVNLIGIQRAN